MTPWYSGLTAGAFGGVAGIAALYFLEGVPRVRRDILQKLPVMGDYWDYEIPASDNVSIQASLSIYPRSLFAGGVCRRRMSCTNSFVILALLNEPQIYIDEARFLQIARVCKAVCFKYPCKVGMTVYSPLLSVKL